jgi:hypothetical protein
MRRMPTTKPKPKKSTRGGARPGAGRKPRGSEAARPVMVPLAPEERGELEGFVGDGELATFIREAALEKARSLDLAAHREAIESVLYPTETFEQFVALAVTKELRARNGGSIEPLRAIFEPGKAPRYEDDDRARPRAQRSKA